MPLPGETALIAAGVFASRGQARHRGRDRGRGDRGDRRRQHRLLDRPHRRPAAARPLGPRHPRLRARAALGRGLLRAAMVPKTIFLARFFSILRVTAAWMAGVSRMHWWTFFGWNAAGGICWALLVGLAAYYGGHAARRRDLPLRADRRRRDRRARARRARRLPLLAQAAGGVAVKRAARARRARRVLGRPVGAASGARLQPRRRGRAREQGARQGARQPATRRPSTRSRAGAPCSGRTAA